MTVMYRKVHPFPIESTPCTPVPWANSSIPIIKSTPICLDQFEKEISTSAYCTNPLRSKESFSCILHEGLHARLLLCEKKGDRITVLKTTDTSSLDIPSNPNLSWVEIQENTLKRESSLLQSLHHPHIVSLLECGSFPRPFLEMEYLPLGTLESLFSKQRHVEMTIPISSIGDSRALSLKACLKIARELASALKYLHEDFNRSAAVIHAGIQPANMGFDACGRLKLFDFSGASCIVKGSCISTATSPCTGKEREAARRGDHSYEYEAPEVVLRQPHDEKVDIYSFGIILWQLVYGRGKRPFKGISRKEHFLQVVVNAKRPPLPTHPSAFDIRLQGLLQECWHADPLRRPSAKHVLAVLDYLIFSLSIGSSAAALLRRCRGLFGSVKVAAAPRDLISSRLVHDATRHQS